MRAAPFRAFKLVGSLGEHLRCLRSPIASSWKWLLALISYWIIWDNSIDFEVPEEKEVLIVLLENDFKHILKEFLLFRSNVIWILNLIGSDVLNRNQRYSWNGPGQVAHRVILVLIVPERSGGYLKPSVYEVLLYAWLELDKLPFPKNFFFRVYDYLIHVSSILICFYWLCIFGLLLSFFLLLNESFFGFSLLNGWIHTLCVRLNWRSLGIVGHFETHWYRRRLKRDRT